MEHEIEPGGDDNGLLPFQDLVAPQPIKAAPPSQARWLALAAILTAGALGAAVGYGIGDLMGGSTNWAAVGALLGGLTGAVGVGVVANLTLRAMNEWHAVQHPEAAGDPETPADDKNTAKPGNTAKRRNTAKSGNTAKLKNPARKRRGSSVGDGPDDAATSEQR